jgi:hypothetical protein
MQSASIPPIRHSFISVFKTKEYRLKIRLPQSKEKDRSIGEIEGNPGGKFECGSAQPSFFILLLHWVSTTMILFF